MNLKDKRKRRLAVLVLLYLLAVVGWLGGAAVRLAIDAARENSGQLAAVALHPADFTVTDGVWVSPEWDEGDTRLITMDPDPRMVYPIPNGAHLTTFTFTARALNKAPGAMHLYYTTAPGQDFSERRKLWAELAPDGSWAFDLGGRKVYALRFDPDSVGGVIWQVEAMALNAGKPAAAYFLPDARAIFLLLFAPPLAAAVLWEAVALVSPWFARRKLEKRWGA